jgi:poly-gamma-glutamate synthesis protein (capsule biosynthesis protein)
MNSLRRTELTDPDHVAALKLGHFDVISFASNHCYDLGPDVFTETIDALREQGFAVIGAGGDIAQARQPAVRRPGCGEGRYRRCSKSTLTWNSLAVRKRSL